MGQTGYRVPRAGREPLTEEELAALIAEVEATGMLRAPVDFKEHVLEKTKRADVQLIIRTQKMSRGMQLFGYSLKIGVAAAMALFFLFAAPQDISLPELSPSRETSWESRHEETLAQRWDRSADEITKQISRLAKQWISGNRIQEDTKPE